MKNREKSVIRRMYLGFVGMIVLFLGTILVMLNGESKIHQQLKLVNSSALPLVNLANQSSVKLLIADKLFKDFLTSNDRQRMRDYEEKFSASHTKFNSTIQQLKNVSSNSSEQIKSQLEALITVEKSYFSEARIAMENYRKQLNAQEERQRTVRRFQKLQTDLRLGMIEYINSKGTDTIKLLAKGYFTQLKAIETVTSDALSSEDIKKVSQAIKINKRSVVRLKFSYQSIATQLPAFKQEFDQDTKRFIQDAGKKGGVLDLHFTYIQAKKSLYENIAVLADEVDKATLILDSFRNESDSLMQGALNNADSIYSQSYISSILLAMGVSIFLILFAVALTQNVRKPLKSILNTLEYLTSGDLTQRAENNAFVEFNRLSNHINVLAGNLQDVLYELNATSDKLTQSADTNKNTISQAENRLHKQAQQTGSVVSAMTELDYSVKDIASSAQTSMHKIHSVEASVQLGSEIMQSNICSIDLLSNNLNSSVEVVTDVKDMSTNIGSILDVIHQIADQTNLLALNAAIEAARAGDKGRGFAVVADEVRVLAEKTTRSTVEIEEMISGLQQKSEDASSVLYECVSEMDKARQQISKANDSIEEIRHSIADVSQMSVEIEQTTEQQALTTEHITLSLEDIRHITKANNDAMQHIAMESKELDELAHKQNLLVQKFRV